MRDEGMMPNNAGRFVSVDDYSNNAEICVHLYGSDDLNRNVTLRPRGAKSTKPTIREQLAHSVKSTAHIVTCYCHYVEFTQRTRRKRSQDDSLIGTKSCGARCSTGHRHNRP